VVNTITDESRLGLPPSRHRTRNTSNRMFSNLQRRPTHTGRKRSRFFQRPSTRHPRSSKRLAAQKVGDCFACSHDSLSVSDGPRR
jgi:hypothetical protein